MIILKNEVKELFESAGIPELTVGRNSSGYLQIVGKECGQPIMTISQVEAPKNLTNAMRKIVIEDYLKPALDKYSKDFISMVVLKKEAKACRDLVDKEAEVLLKQGISDVKGNTVCLITSSRHTYRYNLGTSTFDTMYYVTPEKLNELVELIPTVPKKIKKITKLQGDLVQAEKEAKESFNKVKITCGW